VAAARTNSLGTAGIAAGCSIMPLKVANSSGTMSFSSIQNALMFAADNGADVISMSLGAAISSDPATDNAITYAHNAGCVILAATGNENRSTISYPAIHSLVIGVGAASPCGQRKAPQPDRVNPGVSDPNGYT
jgi:serine protease